MEDNAIDLEAADGAVVVVVSGEHDLASAPALTERIQDAIRARSAVVVDLSAATFIDSTILGVLLEARQECKLRELGFAIGLGGEGGDAVKRILEVTGLIPALTVRESRDDALAAVRAAAN